jgi:hypothetical protein
MSVEKMREEFEAWYLNKFCGGQARLFRCVNADKIYYFTEVQSKWDAWQASRESLVIELPAKNPIGSGTGDSGDGRPSFEQHCAAECNFILRDCREAVEAAGLKVKGEKQ